MTEHEHIQRNRVELTEALQRVFQRWHSFSDVLLLGEALGISAAKITARPLHCANAWPELVATCHTSTRTR